MRYRREGVEGRWEGVGGRGVDLKGLYGGLKCVSGRGKEVGAPLLFLLS